MSLQSATQSVQAGQAQVTVFGAFPAAYQVAVQPAWVTGYAITGKSTTQFTVTFAVPAPAGGSTFDWTAGTPVTPAQGASVAIAAGAVQAVIAGTFTAPYGVGIGPAWVTDVRVVARGATGFTVDFATPAPAGGSTFDWISSPTPSGISAAVTAPLAGATQAIQGGATQLIVSTPGGLPAVYQVIVGTSWVTGTDVVGKTQTGFTINFAVPAPNTGGMLTWIVVGQSIGTTSLADYLAELRDLLHDPNDRFWSATQKANYINRALRRRDIDTAANRSTVSFTLTSGTGTYTFAQVGNGQIFDVLAIALIFGTQRVTLDNPSLTELNQYYRPYTTQTGWTRAWARQGPSAVIFGPT